MAIAGDRPESGIRIAIERDKVATDPPWSYEGAAYLPDTSHPIRVSIDAEGTVDVAFVGSSEAAAAPPPPDLAEKVRLIVRTVFKQAQADDAPPAWRIVRWRAK